MRHYDEIVLAAFVDELGLIYEHGIEKDAGIGNIMGKVVKPIKNQAKSLGNDLSTAAAVGRAHSNTLKPIAGVGKRKPILANAAIAGVNKARGIGAGATYFATKRPNLTEFVGNLVT